MNFRDFDIGQGRDAWRVLIGGVAAFTITAAGVSLENASYVNQTVSGALTATGTMQFTIGDPLSPHVIAPGDQYPWDYTSDYAGDPDGTSSYRTMRLINRLSGFADMDQIHCAYVGHMDQRVLKIDGVTKPTTFVAFTHHFYILNQRDADIQNASVSYAHAGLGSHDWPSSGSFGTLDIYRAGDTAWITDGGTATGIIAGMRGFTTGQLGHPLRCTNLSAFRAEDDSALSTATAYRSDYTAGAGKLGFYELGGAGSQFVGAVGIGDTVLPVNTILSLRRVGLTLGTADNTGSVENIVGSFAGNVDGLSDFRLLRLSLTIQGANSVANGTGLNNVVTVAHTAGTVAAGAAMQNTVTISSAANTTRFRGIDSQVRLAGDGVTDTVDILYARALKTAGTTGSYGTTRGLHVDDGGGAHVSTEAIGVDIENFTNIAGSVTAAYRTKMNAGTGHYAFRNDGSAPLYFGANYVDILEMTAPSAPGADTCRLFVQDNGSGKSQLMGRFSTGAPQQILLQA